MITAILVDGGYYRKIALKKFSEKTPKDCADKLITYCHRHLNQKINGNSISNDLYRIFYYGCPPIDTVVYHPLTKKNVFFKKTEQYQWMNEFLNELTKKRKVALRLGTLSETELHYNLKADTTKKLLENKVQLSELREEDFQLQIRQKGVDMKIGVDIASLSYKKQVNQIILIAGDSDFVPASKLARREGIDFVLDPLGRKIKSDLFEHIDGLQVRDNLLKNTYSTHNKKNFSNSK